MTGSEIFGVAFQALAIGLASGLGIGMVASFISKLFD